MKNRLLIPVMLLILLIITPTIYVVKNYLKENTKIAFVSDQTGNKDIFVINDNGTGLKQLTKK